MLQGSPLPGHTVVRHLKCKRSKYTLLDLEPLRVYWLMTNLLNLSRSRRLSLGRPGLYRAKSKFFYSQNGLGRWFDGPVRDL